MKIKYTGSYLNVTALGISFTRHLPVEVPENEASKLIAARTTEGKAIFVPFDEAPVEELATV